MVTNVINSELNNDLPKGCSCHACQQIAEGVSSSSSSSNNDPVIDPDIGAPIVTATPEQFADYLVNGFWNDRGSIAREWDTSSDNNITYSVNNSYSAAQQAGIRMAFDTWADVANLTFTEVSSGADITIVQNSSGQAYSSSSVYSNGVIATNTISIDTSPWYWQNFNEYGDYDQPEEDVKSDTCP